jgi:hypothetical protein
LLSDDRSVFQVTVTNAKGSVASSSASLSVHPPLDVPTYHYDNSRTGQNTLETFLTPINVNVSSFGRIGYLPVDGKVDAQPLFLHDMNIASLGTRNVLYVATEHDSVYAFDAQSGAVLWQKSVLGPNETPSDDRGCPDAHTPEIGITSTPVIDRSRGPNGVLYLIAMSRDISGNYFQRLHALDISTGNELFGGPTAIQASFPGVGDNATGGNVAFDPKQYFDRAALLLVNGVIYTTWASHCDAHPYTSWIIGYSAATLTQASVLNLTPNGSMGAIWMSGGGPAADTAGNIYLMNGNGTFDDTLDVNGFPSHGDFGNCFLKLSTTNGLAVADYFTTYDTDFDSDSDIDFGAGGVLVLPDLTDASGKVLHLALGGGKSGAFYVLNRDAMGRFNPSRNETYQLIPFTTPLFSTPTYFSNTVYVGAVHGPIRAFTISGARLSDTSASQTAISFPYPGATTTISANGTKDAILWAVENGDPAVLRAYKARNLSNELYNSNQALSRDQFGPGNKFITPTVANGKVYVGTTDGVAIFGLLH